MITPPLHEAILEAVTREECPDGGLWTIRETSQPAVRLRPMIREAFANNAFSDIDAMEDAREARRRCLRQHPEVVRPSTTWHWRPDNRSGQGSTSTAANAS